jgi:polar amino acid transport system substrate-binding protein
MVRKSWPLLLLILLPLWFASPLPAAPPLLIYVDEANPPFMYRKLDQAVGLYPAIIRRVFAHLELVVDVRAIPWKRALMHLDQGLAGVGGIYKNTERLKKYDFSEALYMEKLNLYHHASRPFNYLILNDLKDLTVGIMRGWSYGDDFDLAKKDGLFKTEEVDGDTQNFQKLLHDRIDVVVAVEESGSIALKNYNGIDVCPIPLNTQLTFLAFAKSANHTSLLKKFDQILKQMRESGEFAKIIAMELDAFVADQQAITGIPEVKQAP